MIFAGKSHVFYRAYVAAVAGGSTDPDLTPERVRDLAVQAGQLADAYQGKHAMHLQWLDVHLAALAGCSAQTAKAPADADALAVQAADLATS